MWSEQVGLSGARQYGKSLAKNTDAVALSKMLDGAAYSADPRVSALLFASAIKLRELAKAQALQDLSRDKRNA